jgi:hypothetical protein
MARQTAKDKSKKQIKNADKFRPVNDRQVQKIKQQRTFEPHNRKPKIGNRLVFFRRPGDTIEGVLGPPIRNYHSQSTYPLQLESGETVEVPGNQHLARVIKKHKLIGEFVRIKFEGKMITGGGHYRKIYHVAKMEQRGEALTLIKELKQCLKKQMKNSRYARTANAEPF